MSMSVASEAMKIPKGEEDEKIQVRRRRWLFFFACLYTFLFVGSFYGWGPMQLALEENSAFDWKCEANSTATEDSSSSDAEMCAEQRSALLNINLIAITTQILSPLLGHFVDTCGPRAGIYFLTACLWSGLSLVTFASSRNTHENTAALDRLLYVGFCLLALVTWMGGLLTVQVGMYFDGHTRSRAIIVLNTLFDAGAVVYLAVLSIADAAPDLSLTVWMGLFLGLSICIMSGSLYFWVVTEKAPDSGDEDKSDFFAVDDSTLVATSHDDKPASTTITSSGHASSVSGQEEEVESEIALMFGLEDASASADKHSSSPVDSDKVACWPEDTGRGDTIAVEGSCQNEYVLVSNRSTKDQLLSYPFLLLCTFFAIQYTSYQWNVSTMREFLAYLGDDDYDNRYLTIFIALLPAGILTLPLVDAVLIHLGFTGAFQCINALALGYTLVKVSSESLPVQVVGFVIFVIFCCMLFGVVFSFLPVLLADNTIGKASGIMFAVTGVTSFICIPLSRLAVQDLDGNFFIPNLIFCALVVPSTLLAYGLGRCVKRENEVREQRKALSMSRKQLRVDNSDAAALQQLHTRRRSALGLR